MSASAIFRCALAAGVTVTALAPAMANPIGAWDYQSSAKTCSIGTTGTPGKLIMLYTSSGSSGFLVVPDDQSSITADHDYPLKVSLEGSPDMDMTGSALNFGGSKVLVLDVKAAGLAAEASDGFSFRVKMNGAVVFDKDMHGSKDAFAAFVACTKTLAK